MRNLIAFILGCILPQSLFGQNLWDTVRAKGEWTTDEKAQQAIAFKAQWI